MQQEKLTWCLIDKYSEKEFNDIYNFFISQPSTPFFQLPAYAVSVLTDDKWKYALAYVNDKLIGIALIRVKKSYIADILFGPIVAISYEHLYSNALFGNFLKKHFLISRVQPEIQSENAAKGNSFATIIINTEEEVDTLWINLSNNHKRSIKKALNNNITTQTIENEIEIGIFVEGIRSLYNRRNLKFDSLKNENYFEKTIKLLIKNPELGEAILVRNEDSVIGGAIWLNFKNRWYYDAGFSDNSNKIPVLHFAFWNAILKAKELDMSVDLGGYAINPNEQLKAINLFKEGFGGNVVYYPSNYIIFKNTLLKFLFNLYSKLRN
jgi:hypothetical protein